MTGDELVAAISRADQTNEFWSLIVRHEDGQLELYAREGSMRIANPETVVGIVRECLLSDEPVDCDVAADAGVDFDLEVCERCEGH